MPIPNNLGPGALSGSLGPAKLPENMPQQAMDHAQGVPFQGMPQQALNNAQGVPFQNGGVPQQVPQQAMPPQGMPQLPQQAMQQFPQQGMPQQMPMPFGPQGLPMGFRPMGMGFNQANPQAQQYMQQFSPWAQNFLSRFR